MARKQISEALFKKIVEGLEKLGISLSEVLGTRTGVKKIGKSLTKDFISPMRMQMEVDTQEGVERILRLFREDARYLHEMNELEGAQFLTNINQANKIVHPDPLPEAGIFSLKEGKKLTSKEFLAKEASDQAKIENATLKAAMETSKVDQDLAKKLNLDMSKASDFDKLQAWKKQHNLPDWGGEQGLGSLFKTRKQNELADLGTQLDSLEAEGKSLATEAQKLVDMAWKMSPEGMATEEAARKALLKRMNEGKGFAGGVFGPRNDGYFRAIVRPFLLDQHAKGKIKLADNTLESLKNADDLKGGGDFMSADPVRVFRQHYGDDAFDLIPDQEAFGMGDTGYGPGRDRINEVMNEVIGEPVLKVGPDNPGGYLTKGEYQAKLDERDEVMGYIKNREGRFSDMSEQEIAEEIAGVNQQHDSIKMAMEIDYPKVTKTSLNLRLMKNFDQPLDDIGLAEEGYNVQEIQVLKNARNRMTTGEEIHPNEALLREKELLADDAGIDVDELELDIDWGDMTPEPFASGGGVGSLFRKTDRARYSTGTQIGKEVAKFAGKTIGEIMEILKKNKKIRELIEKTNKKLHETGIVKMWYEKTKLDKDSKLVAEKVLAPFVETVDKMVPWKTSSKSSRQSTLAWFREELTNPEFKKVYHPHWGEGRTVYRGEKSKKNLEYSEKNPSNMFQHGENVDYMFKPENVGSFASKDPSQAINYATKAEGFPRVTKTHLDPIEFQEAVERNIIENPYGSTADVILNAEQKAALKTDLLATGIATAKKYWPFNKGGLVSRQTLYENGVGSMFRRV